MPLSVDTSNHHPMPKVKSHDVIEEILIDNDAVRVTRITMPPGATQVPSEPRLDRVVVSVTPTTIHRSSDTGVETIERDAGHAVFRKASTHAITNHFGADHVSVIVELKR